MVKSELLQLNGRAGLVALVLVSVPWIPWTLKPCLSLMKTVNLAGAREFPSATNAI